MDKLDTNFHLTLRTAFEAYRSLTVQCDSYCIENADTLLAVVKAVDSKTDKVQFFKSNSGTFAPAARWSFIPGVGEQVATLVNDASTNDGLAAHFRGAAEAVHKNEMAIGAEQVNAGSLCSRRPSAAANVGSLPTEGKEKSPAETAGACFETFALLEVAAFKRHCSLNIYRSLEKVLHPNVPDPMFKIRSQDDSIAWSNPIPDSIKAPIRAAELQFAPHLGLLPALDHAISRTGSNASVGSKRGSQSATQFKHLAFGGTLSDCAAGSGLPVPLLVSSCIKALSEDKAIREEGLFRVPGANAEIADLKNAFERGNDPLVGGAAGHDPNAIAGTLKLYLRSLANPVLTFENYALFVGLMKLPNEEQMLLAVKKLFATRMPAEHIAVLKVLLPFLLNCAKHKANNRMDVPNLAMVFGPGLLQAPLDDLEAIMRDQTSVNRITMFLIQNHEKIFGGRSGAGASSESDGTAAAAAAAASASPAAVSSASSSPPRSPHRNSPPPPEKRGSTGSGESGDGGGGLNSRQLTVRTKPSSPATPSQPKPALVRSPPGRTARAKFDYEARSDLELSFKAGESMTVFDSADSNWWNGELNGQKGCIPAAYVIVLEGEDSTPAVAATPEADYMSVEQNSGRRGVGGTHEEDPYLVVADDAAGGDATGGSVISPEKKASSTAPSPVMNAAAAIAAAAAAKVAGNGLRKSGTFQSPVPRDRTDTGESSGQPAAPPKPGRSPRSERASMPAPSVPPPSGPPPAASVATMGSAGTTSGDNNPFTNSDSPVGGGPPSFKPPSGPPGVKAKPAPPPAGNKRPPPKAAKKPPVRVSEASEEGETPPPMSPPSLPTAPMPPADDADDDAGAVTDDGDEAADGISPMRRLKLPGVKKERPVSVGPSFAPPPPPPPAGGSDDEAEGAGAGASDAASMPSPPPASTDEEATEEEDDGARRASGPGAPPPMPPAGVTDAGGNDTDDSGDLDV